MAELYMKRGHEKGHEGVISSLHRSRRDVWIVNGQPLVEAIKTSCSKCRLKEKRGMNQRMGPCPTTEWGRLLSHFSRACGIHGHIFADSFLMVLQQFMCPRGVP
jgi:hypothetical protein